MAMTKTGDEWYAIRVRGRLDSHWCDWFEWLTLTPLENGETRISGPVRDQAALFGILAKIRDLGLHLDSLVCEEIGSLEVNMNLLKDKVALVTGSSRGIGAAIARTFAGEGAKVVVHGRDAQAMASVKADIERSGGKAMQIAADVTRFEEIERMRRQIEDEFGPLDVLVANAGGSFTLPSPLEETSEEGWRASVEGNLTATFLTLKSFLPGMKGRGAGNIITISSAAARRPSPASPMPYAAAKAGIQILTQELAAQAGPNGIRVNCIAPETILTERNQEQIPDMIKEKLLDMHPVKRLGMPEDVARAALFLASDQAEWISGMILDVAGGSVLV